MNYEGYIGKRAFVQSPHGLHYGTVTQMDYDNIELREAVFFITVFTNEDWKSCAEYMATTQVSNNNIKFSAGKISSMIITNAKEIVLVEKLSSYYDDLFSKQR